MNLGAGRVAVPDMPRIDKAIEDGSLAKNPILIELIATLKKNGNACHLLGLASPGGVHAHQDQLIALANMIAEGGVPVWIHAFLDGRDTPPRSALEYLEQIAAGLKKDLPIKFATIGGRYYAMDRDKRWDRVEKAYDCIVDARGETAKTPEEAVDKAYAAKLDDEFVLPTAIDGYQGMKDGDGLLMFNYRSDRAREILTALLDPMFDGFKRGAPREVRRCRRHGRILRRAERLPQDAVSARRHQDGPRRDDRARRPQAAAHRRNREVRARHLLLQRRRGAAVRGRGAHPGSLAQGRRPTTSSPR